MMMVVVDQQKQPPRPIPVDFVCKERVVVDNNDYYEYGSDSDNSEDDDDYDGYTFQFSCTVPSVSSSDRTVQPLTTNRTLNFQCRGRSVGVMLESDGKHDEEEQQKEEDTGEGHDEGEEEEQPMVDPFFFDDGYTLAGRTGFQVWAGSRLLLESLLYPLHGNNNNNINNTTSSTDSEIETAVASQNTPFQDTTRLKYWQKNLLKTDEDNATNSSPTKLKILELGSGVGLVGMSLAAIGHEVLLTDLPTLIKHSVNPNMKLNGRKTKKQDTESCNERNALNDENPTARTNSPVDTLEASPPSWLSSVSSNETMTDKTKKKHRPCIVPILASTDTGMDGHNRLGWTRSLSLDWTKPLEGQIPNARQTLHDLDLIIASDCVWLKSMLDSLLDTVESIFHLPDPNNKGGRSPSLIMSFQRRDKNGNKNNNNSSNGPNNTSTATSSSPSMFTTVEGVLQAIQDRGWTWEVLAWRYTEVEAEDHEKEEVTGQTGQGQGILRREVYVVEVRSKQ